MSADYSSKHGRGGQFFSTLSRPARRFYATLRKALQNPEPLLPDLPSWVPRRPRAFAKTLLVIAIMFVASWLFIRWLDVGFDDPNEFEQIYTLNNAFTGPKKEVSVNCNLFGGNSKQDASLKARLVKVLGHNSKDISIDILQSSFIEIWPAEVRPGKTEIVFAASPKYQSLKAALEDMAKAGFAEFAKPTRTRGEVYSLDLAMDVYRTGQRVQSVAETFHFRVDTIIERLFVALIILLGCLGALFIVDLTQTVAFVRAREFLRAAAAILSEVSKLLTRLLSIGEIIQDIQKPIIASIKLILRYVAQALDKFTAIPKRDKAVDKIEYAEFETQPRYIDQAMSGLPPDETEESEQVLRKLQDQTEDLRRHINSQKERGLRPLLRADMRAEISQANEHLQDAYGKLKSKIIELNAKRDEEQDRFYRAYDEKKKEIARMINDFFDRSSIKRDMAQLGKYFPVTEDPVEIFETPQVYAKGETEYDDRQLRLTFPSFVFPISDSHCGIEQAIWIKIEKQESGGYSLSQASKNRQGTIPPGVTCISLTDHLGNVIEIKYCIKLRGEKTLAFQGSEVIAITPNHIDLAEPSPDPAKFLAKLDIPPRPKIITIR